MRTPPAERPESRRGDPWVVSDLCLAGMGRPAPCGAVAVFSMHTSPLAQPGAGDGGGMNVYVRALASALAGAGVECDVYTRSEDPAASGRRGRAGVPGRPRDGRAAGADPALRA